MNEQWQEYSGKYSQLSIREQYLILLTGLVAIFFIIFYMFVDPTIIENKKANSKIERLTQNNQSLKISIAELENALKTDPNEALRDKISQFEDKLAKVMQNY